MSIETTGITTPDGFLSYEVVVCDRCGNRSAREACGSDWLTVERVAFSHIQFGDRWGLTRHFCTEECLAGYMIGLTVVEGVEA